MHDAGVTVATWPMQVCRVTTVQRAKRMREERRVFSLYPEPARQWTHEGCRTGFRREGEKTACGNASLSAHVFGPLGPGRTSRNSDSTRSAVCSTAKERAFWLRSKVKMGGLCLWRHDDCGLLRWGNDTHYEIDGREMTVDWPLYRRIRLPWGLQRAWITPLLLFDCAATCGTTESAHLVSGQRALREILEGGARGTRPVFRAHRPVARIDDSACRNRPSQ